MKPTNVYSAFAAILITIPLYVTTSAAAHAAGPSYDCNAASADDEVAICSSSKLSELDNLMASGFQYLRLQLGKREANKVAKPLLSLRQSCGSDTDCIQERQIDAIETYRKLGAPVRLPKWASASANQQKPGNEAKSGLPTRIGACATSSITEVGGRLEGDDNFESGTSVAFANDGFQVSYDKEWGIIRSAIGDPVRICLVSLPKGCPPGDDRGKVYRTTNLRTGEHWELPDSQHECGGA
jgi:uncharacterized protein